MFESRSLAQLKRFCLVGAICYVSNILAMAGLCELLGVPYVPAYVVVFIMGCALGYWLNKRFTFELSTAFDAAALFRYLLVNCTILALSTAALHVLVEWWHVWYLGAVTLLVVLSAPISFAVHRIISYRVTA